MINLIGKIIIDKCDDLDRKIQMYKITDVEYDEGTLLSFEADCIGGDMSIMESFDDGFYDRYDVITEQEAIECFKLWIKQ